MKSSYHSYDDLPLALNADDVASVLGISRAGAYSLMHSKNNGFPTVFIGKRMIVPRPAFLDWLSQQLSTTGGTANDK